jgi:hypothetical protein
VANEVLKQCFAPLPPSDRATLLELLRRLNEGPNETL